MPARARRDMSTSGLLAKIVNCWGDNLFVVRYEAETLSSADSRLSRSFERQKSIFVALQLRPSAYRSLLVLHRSLER